MGFFTSSELTKKAAIKVDVDTIKPDCLKCKLYKSCMTPKMPIAGEGRKKILIIGEVPGREEDEYGVPLIGAPGKFLAEELKDIGISLNKDCWKINAVNCYPTDSDGKFRQPSHTEIKCCNPYVEKTIRELKPKVIVLLGNIAITSILGNEFSNRKITRWRNFQIPDEKYGCYILPLFHPSYVVRNEKDKNLRSLFFRDLKSINKCLKRDDIQRINHEEKVTILRSFDKIVSVLNRVIKRKQKIAFDYECTGLKPYRIGHKIATIAFAVNSNKAYAFPYEYRSTWTPKELSKIRSLWAQILSDPEIPKICHNLKFEDSWSKIFFGTRIKNAYWDTMIAQKIIDNRSAAAGLKFQTYVRFGVRPYDKSINPFLKSKDGEFNTVEKAPLRELLIYNGLDCIFTFMMFKQQNKYLIPRKWLLRAYNFFMRGIRTMGTLQLNGITVDTNFYAKAEIELDEKIKDGKKYLTEGREARKFKEKFQREINVNSNADLGKLFFEVLGKKPVYTANGNYKTDKTVLESLNLPFVDKLLSVKKYEKIKGTYLAQFKREVVDDTIHPFFDLHIPVSYRSSSSMPNFQNIPKRDAEAKDITRRGIVPHYDLLAEVDFSGAEVATSASYHKDKNFINYLIDPHSDMHRDNATDLFLLPKDMLERKDYTKEQKKKVKMIRFFAKNCWTFAQFYGDWFGSCGAVLWENVVDAGLMLPNGVSVKDHLEDKGIFELGEVGNDGPTPGSFLEHCKKVEHKMWNERFPDYTQWKKDINESYQRHGFIETYFGFRFTGYMDWKQCCNYPIQGTSFHLLLFTLTKVDAFIRKHKLKTKLIGQIHDSIILDMPKEEAYFVLKNVNKIVADLKNRFQWMVVPMEIEIELSQLKENGGCFAEMEEYKLEQIKEMYG